MSTTPEKKSRKETERPSSKAAVTWGISEVFYYLFFFFFFTFISSIVILCVM